MKTVLVCNWKMNPGTLKEAKELFDATRKAAEKAKNVSVVVAPPSIFISELRARYKGKKIMFAGQSARAEDGGSYTGDISILQVKKSGCDAVLIGHAERRAQGETDDNVQKKVIAALNHGLSPIVCIGESMRGNHGEHFDFIRGQIRAAFSGVPVGKINKVIVAYEPVWAIGAPEPMAPRDMHEMSIFIRKAITECYEMEMKVPRIAPVILYGGAIDVATAGVMMREGEVAGLLVGRASQKKETVSALIAALS